MTTQSMNHQQAVETMAAERYLLREMKPDERRAFEEHYLECAECLEAVTFGSEFMEAGHQVAMEQKRVPAPVPAWRERMLSVFGPWLRPAPALVFALLLCVAGLTYQATTIHRQQQTIASLQGMKPEFRLVVTGEQRGAGPERVVTVRRNTQLSVKYEFTPGEEFKPYRVDLVSGNTVKYSMPLAAGPNDDSISFSIPSAGLDAGNYSLVIRRQNGSGTSKDLTRNFVLQFAD